MKTRYRMFAPESSRATAGGGCRSGFTMVELALEYPEYRAAARKVRIVKTTSEKYYGRGYQDMQNRVPKIDNTKRELRWAPRTGMRDALRNIYDAYRSDVAEAKHLVK